MPFTVVATRNKSKSLASSAKRRRDQGHQTHFVAVCQDESGCKQANTSEAEDALSSIPDRMPEK